MKRFPELKPNFWDVIVVLAVIALAVWFFMSRDLLRLVQGLGHGALF